MAIYPCRIGNHRYPQAQQMAYCTILRDDLAVTYRARLCPKHFRSVYIVGEESMDLVTEESQSSSKCGICSADKFQVMFLRCFPSKEEERAFALDACEDCADQVAGQLQVALWEPLPAR